MVPLWDCAASGVQLANLKGPDEIEGLVRFFENIAETEGWKPEGALRQWTDRSDYFAVLKGGTIAGGLQLVRPDPSGNLPYSSVWPEVPGDRCDRSAHAAVLAVAPEFRGRSELFWSLAVEAWRHCVTREISTIFLEVTPRVLPLYRRLGWPLQMRGGRKAHWGEDCYLCSMGIPDVSDVILRRAEASAFYRGIVLQAFRLDVSSPMDERDTLSVGWGSLRGASVA